MSVKADGRNKLGSQEPSGLDIYPNHRGLVRCLPKPQCYTLIPSIPERSETVAATDSMKLHPRLSLVHSHVLSLCLFIKMKLKEISFDFTTYLRAEAQAESLKSRDFHVQVLRIW